MLGAAALATAAVACVAHVAEARTTHGNWDPPKYNASVEEALRTMECVNAPERPARDPYEPPQPPHGPPPEGQVCALRFAGDGCAPYALEQFASKEEALGQGAVVTHAGPCGTCSTTVDLAAYMAHKDMMTAGRRCGVVGALEGEQAGVQCFVDLGLTVPCALTWLWNAENTRKACLWPCLWAWLTGEPNTTPSGDLNACLECDETQSGPIFKAVAGRTRRRSGLISAIPRPASEVAEVVHTYWRRCAPP